MTTVAVIGNTYRNIGAACAGDFALAGHDVRYALYAEQAAQLEAIRKKGGLVVEGHEKQLVSGKNGLAKLTLSDDPTSILSGADVVMLDIPMPVLEERFKRLIPKLPKNCVVHVQSHGYWLSARLTPLLRAAGRDDVLVTDASVPTTGGAFADGVVTVKSRRFNIEIGTIPISRIDEALAKLRTLVPDFQAAKSGLQTGLENANLIVHPAMILLGVGQFEAAAKQGKGHRFYTDSNVPSAGRLADAMDAERGRVCLAYGVRHKTFAQHINTYYGTQGTTAYEAVTNCKAYQAIGEFPTTIWQDWEKIDVPYAIVPLVRLAEQAGIAVPVHRSLAEILGVLLGVDPWNCGPTLKDMALEGAPAEVAKRF